MERTDGGIEREGPDAPPPAADAGPAESEPEARLVRRAVRRAVRPVAEHVVEPVHEHVIEPVAGRVEPVAEFVEPVGRVVEPVVGFVAGAVGSVLRVGGRAISGPHAARRRQLQRANRIPLANLYDLHPEARLATPREIGFRFVPLEEICGTAVAGIAQRGSDFKPLKPFRGDNWESRWARIERANAQLKALPPIDLVKYDGGYWVIDGHNRVAAALYAGGVGLDAMVTELVPLDGHLSEQPSDLLALMPEAGELRAAVAGDRPAFGVAYSPRTALAERAAEEAEAQAAAQETAPAPGSGSDDVGGTTTEGAD